jgi:hypothetical protein
MAFKVEKSELKKVAPYILIAFFGFYILEPGRQYLQEHVPLAPLYIGIIGVALTLYFFDFR